MRFSFKCDSHLQKICFQFNWKDRSFPMKHDNNQQYHGQYPTRDISKLEENSSNKNDNVLKSAVSEICTLGIGFCFI